MAEISEKAERPLWRRIVDFPLVAMVIAVAVFVFAAQLAMWIEHALPAMPRNERTPINVVIDVVLQFAMYKLVTRRLGERPRDDLRWNGALRNLGLGLVGGAVLFGIVTAAAAAAGVYSITDCCRVGQLIRDLFEATILAGFAEELLFRGILFRWIEEFAGSWAALILTSALFGFVHIENPGATWFSSFAIAVEAGLLLGGAYMLTRSLWAPIGLHAAWNFTQGYVFDIPVSGVPEQGLVQAKLAGPPLLSGGQFGLEASVLGLLVATAAGVGLVIIAVRRGEVMKPWWTQRRQLSGSPMPDRVG